MIALNVQLLFFAVTSGLIGVMAFDVVHPMVAVIGLVVSLSCASAMTLVISYCDVRESRDRDHRRRGVVSHG